MSPEKWQELKGTILDRYEVLENQTIPLETSPGSVERLVCKTPAGTIKLEFTTKPRVVGERGMGSKRIGSSVTIERQYSPDEQVTIFKAYRRSADQTAWQEIDPAALA